MRNIDEPKSIDIFYILSKIYNIRYTILNVFRKSVKVVTENKLFSGEKCTHVIYDSRLLFQKCSSCSNAQNKITCALNAHAL